MFPPLASSLSSVQVTVSSQAMPPPSPHSTTSIRSRGPPSYTEQISSSSSCAPIPVRPSPIATPSYHSTTSGTHVYLSSDFPLSLPTHSSLLPVCPLKTKFCGPANDRSPTHVQSAHSISPTTSGTPSSSLRSSIISNRTVNAPSPLSDESLSPATDEPSPSLSIRSRARAAASPPTPQTHDHTSISDDEEKEFPLTSSENEEEHHPRNSTIASRRLIPASRRGPDSPDSVSVRTIRSRPHAYIQTGVKRRAAAHRIVSPSADSSSESDQEKKFAQPTFRYPAGYLIYEEADCYQVEFSVNCFFDKETSDEELAKFVFNHSNIDVKQEEKKTFLYFKFDNLFHPTARRRLKVDQMGLRNSNLSYKRKVELFPDCDPTQCEFPACWFRGQIILTVNKFPREHVSY